MISEGSEPRRTGTAAVAGSERPVNSSGTSTNAATATTPSPIHNVMDMSDPIVVSHPPTIRRRRRWPWVLLGLIVALAGATFVIPTSYYLYEPGSVRPTETNIAIRDHPSFHSRGEVLLTTIGISDHRASVAELVRAALDDAIDAVPAAQAYPAGRHKDQVENQAAMDGSKLAATVAALHKLGYTATITGTGAFVDAIDPHNAASHSFHQGDVITSIDGKPVTTVVDLHTAMANRSVGATVQVGVRTASKGPERVLTVTLGANASAPGQGFLGVAVSTAGQGLRTPFPVSIDSGQVIGPSAGLAWTLGLIDRLTPGDLTGGKEVAVTGTIDANGNVGPIGEVTRKLATVKRAGVKEFIFPKDTDPAEVKAVRALAGHDVELHQVATLDEALAVLVPHGLPAAPAA